MAYTLLCGSAGWNALLVVGTVVRKHIEGNFGRQLYCLYH